MNESPSTGVDANEKEERIEFIDNGIFKTADDDPELRAEILAEIKIEDKINDATAKKCEGDAYLRSLYKTPLLERQQEYYLFRQMNYLKYLAEKLRGEQNNKRGKSKKIEDLMQKAIEVRNQIIESNLRLVFSLSKRYATCGTEEFDELICQGNIVLIPAVEKFDFSRSVKFSTYATWAILNKFNRLYGKQKTRNKKTEQNPYHIEDAHDYRMTRKEEGKIIELRILVRQLLDKSYKSGILNEREIAIIKARFGLDCREQPQILKEIGYELGLTKERIRQILAKALGKLRSATSTEPDIKDYLEDQ